MPHLVASAAFGKLELDKVIHNETVLNRKKLTGCPGKWWSHHPWRCSNTM